MLVSLAGCANDSTSSKTGYGADTPTEPTDDVISSYIDGTSSGADIDSSTPTSVTDPTAATTTAVHSDTSIGAAAGTLAAGKTEDITEGDIDFDYGFADDAADSFAPVAGDVLEDSACVEGEFSGESCVEITPPAIQPEAGLLTGGEWNDNDHWHDWVSLYQTHEEWNEYRDIWEIDFDIRHEVIVTAFGEPVEGAQVVQRNCGNIGVTSAVTNNEGKAYLFLEKCSDDMEHTLEVTYGEVRVTIEDVDAISSGTYTIDLSESSLSQDEVSDVDTLELMLMIDTTGSMWDELAYLQKELEDVITRVKQDNGNIPIRVSVNFYRDEGDEYVIREFEFTEDIEKVLIDLAEQEADGGGDIPEAVHTALSSATKSHEWKDNATKLMFFVLDAPPHSDAQIIDEVNDRVEIAAAQGIRIIPVASSGIDKSTEYLLRTMAFRTGGTYTFLTDHSGIGGDHIEPTIGDYEVEMLNDMMVRIINSYIE